MNKLTAILLILLTLAPMAISAETSLSLQQAIDAALAYSHRVKAAIQDSAAAYEDYKAAVSGRYPTLSVEARTNYISNLIKITSLPVPNPVELGSKENYQADFRLTLPLYTGGKLTSQIGLTREELTARGYDLEAERLATAFNCRKAYLGLQLTEALVGSARASLNRIKTIQDDVSHLYANGLADSVDILEAELAYEKGKGILLQQENGRTRTSQGLAVITGMEVNTIYELPEADSRSADKIEKYLKISPDSSDIVRPELSALQARIASADRLVQLSKGGYLPNLSAFAGYSAGKPNRNMFDVEYDDYFSVGAMLTWDFNLGFKTKREVARAKYRRASLQSTRDQVNDVVFLEAQKAKENLKLAYDSYRIAQREKEITANKYRLAREKQKAGDLSVNRLVEMESELTAAEQLYSAAIINFYLAESEYLYTMGSSEIYGGIQ